MKHGKVRFLFTSVLLVVVLLTSVGNVGAYASSEIKAPGDSAVVYKTINEYEVISDLAKQSTNELLATGYTYQEIQDIRNYKQLYIEHIEDLNNLSTSTLQLHGYSASQIQDIRSFTGKEEQIARVAAHVDLYAKTSSFEYDGDYTRGKFIYSWIWTGVPGFKLTDIVGIAWNDWITESERSTVSYMNIETGEYTYSKSAVFSSKNLGTEGVSHKFLVSEDSNYSYAKTGNGSFTIRSDTHVRKDLVFYASYGHSKLTVDPSFSVSFSGADASISFSRGVTEEDYVKDQVICP